MAVNTDAAARNVAHNAESFAQARHLTGITFKYEQNGTDASVTYTRGDIEAALYVEPSEDGAAIYGIGLLDRRDSDYTLVIDFTTEDYLAASRVFALAALMARAPRTAAAWLDPKGMNPTTHPVETALLALEWLPAHVAASDEPAVVATEPEPAPEPAAPMHADGIPVVFDVVAPTREAAGRALARWITRHAETFPVEVESWWFPEVEDRAVVGNDNDVMTLVAVEDAPAARQTVADLDDSDDAASWLIPGHVLTAPEVAYLRGLILP